jgi:hypothetical protein
LCPRTFVLFTLHTLLNAVICRSQFNTRGVFGRYPRGWIISHRCSWMAVYVFCCNAHTKSHSDPHDICTLSLFYQLVNFNLFTLPLVNCGPRSNFLYIVTPFYYYSHCLLSRILLLLSTRYAQSFVYSKPVRLTTSS